jgi:hypothetical protein
MEAERNVRWRKISAKKHDKNAMALPLPPILSSFVQSQRRCQAQ